MDLLTYKKLLIYLRRFRKNYNYFLSTYSGKNLSLYLDQFVRDQIKMAQFNFGDEGAKRVKEYADRIPH